MKNIKMEEFDIVIRTPVGYSKSCSYQWQRDNFSELNP